MQDKINRLRALADAAKQDYREEIEGGGEPIYPAWADDMLEVCRFAEKAIGRVSHDQ